MNNDSEYNPETTDSEDSDMELVSPGHPAEGGAFQFPQSPYPAASPKNGNPIGEDDEDFKMRRWLLETLFQMSQKERGMFLEFCTSCARLPIGRVVHEVAWRCPFSRKLGFCGVWAFFEGK